MITVIGGSFLHQTFSRSVVQATKCGLQHYTRSRSSTLRSISLSKTGEYDIVVNVMYGTILRKDGKRYSAGSWSKYLRMMISKQLRSIASTVQKNRIKKDQIQFAASALEHL